MNKLRVGVIGAGNIAKTVHIPAYLADERLELIALCDANLASAQAACKQYGIPAAYGDAMEMLQSATPDIISICVPNAFHCQLAIDSMSAGAHVFCEKPPALSYAEVEKMAEIAQKEKKTLAFNFHHRYRGEVNKLKELIAKEAFGKIYHGKAIALRRRAIPGWGVFTNGAIQGGGALIDIGIHMLDAVLYLLNFPKPSYVAAGSYDFIGKQGGEGQFGAWNGGEKFSVEDALFAMIGFEDGFTLSLETSFALHNAQQETTQMNFSLYGDKAGANLAPFQMHTAEGKALVDRSVPFINANYQSAAIQDFIDSIFHEKPSRCHIGSVMETQYLIEKLYQSAQEKKPINL